jgi:translocation and assembly module TamB
MRRFGKALAWTSGILAAVISLLIVAVLITANTRPGRELIERMVPKITDGLVKLQGLGGRFPWDLQATRIEVADADGSWLVIESLLLDWKPSHLLIGEALIDRLTAERVELARLPTSSAESSETSTFSLPLQMQLKSLAVARFDLGEAVAGSAETLSIKGQGQGRLASLEQGDIVLDIRQLGGTGRYHLDARFDPSALAGQLTVEEPANGLVARLAGLPDLGAISLEGALKGPRSAVASDVSLNAGPLSAQVKGKLDLLDDAADLRVTAAAPAMAPSPDISWQAVSLEATLSGKFEQPTAVGSLHIAALRAGGAEVRDITADVQGDRGRLQLHAALEGLHIPGDRPDVLAAAPVKIQAEARLDKPKRPLVFTIDHPLIRIQGDAKTAGVIQAAISLSLPELAPLAAAAGTAVQGHSKLELHVGEKGGATTLDATGNVAITGGAPPLPGLLGDSAEILVSGILDGQDLTLSLLQLDGKGIQLSAKGGLISRAASLDWRLSLPDMALLTPTLSGELQSQGRVEGPVDDLSATADLSGELATKGFPSAPINAHLQAKGIPSTPSGEVKAQGTIAGSPLELSILAQHSADGATRMTIEQADWKSAHGKGQMTLAPGSIFPVGSLDLGMTRLQDLQPFIGQALAGSVTAKLQTASEDGKSRAQLQVQARTVKVPGMGAVESLGLAATVLDPITKPDLDAKLVIDGLSAQEASGSGRLNAKGPLNAIALQVAADARDPDGKPLGLTGKAVLDATGKEIALEALKASWKGETLRLLAPAQIAFAEGVALKGLRLGIRDAMLDASGSISPSLDLTAKVRNLSPSLASAFVPSLEAEGNLSAEAALSGTLARPSGKVQIKATGLHMRTGPAASLPAAGITATATLAGESARIESRLTLGPKAKLAVTGQAPLSQTGRLDLRAKGSVDLSLADPVLTASGYLVRGQVQLNAGISGTLTAPRLGGTVQLVHGEVQDYSLGAHLKDIEALFQLVGDRVQVARLTARAGQGTISASGTIGALQPDLPVDLRLEANRARPLASDLLTVTLDAGLTASGQLAKEVQVSGNVHIDKAEIRIPKTLPVSVATLNVRRPGEKPPTASSAGQIIKLDLSIEAPDQIFVRGRGLDAEVGGKVRVEGTATDPRPIGSFELKRGQFSLANQTLTFSEGKVSFNGGSLTDPSLDFVVSRDTADVAAELSIGGTARNPKITLSSTPRLPQDEILAQILFGRSATSLSAFEVAQIASALAELTGVTSGGINPLGSIRKGLGLDELTVGTDADGKATLEAGRYVAPGVYVGVEQGASAASTRAKVEVDLTKRLKLEGTFGESGSSATGSSGEGGSSIGVTYEFEY